jgi:hypothetical protein
MSTLSRESEPISRAVSTSRGIPRVYECIRIRKFEMCMIEWERGCQDRIGVFEA